MTDRLGAGSIELRGLHVVGYCGVLPEEQDRPQPLEIDVDVELDLTASASSDDLRDTIDYGALCASIEAVAAGERFALLERLAARLAEVCLADDRVEAVVVVVRKLRPPVPQQLSTSGVRLRRTRS